MLKAIFFDFDGVIAESFDVKTRAFADLFAPYGPEIVDRVVAHHLANGGVSRFEKIRHYHRDLIGAPLDEEQVQEWCGRFSALVLDAVVAAPFVPGARELLEACHRRYPCFVVSGTPQEEMELIVRRKGLEEFFVEVHGSPRTKTEIVRQLLAAHRLDPAGVLFLGDAMADYEAAAAAGTAFVGRVPPGHPSIFPAEVPVVADFVGFRPESFCAE